MTRRIHLELVRDGVIKETLTCDAESAKALLASALANRYRWQIVPPDRTGELLDDEARFAADCEACSVPNTFDN